MSLYNQVTLDDTTRSAIHDFALEARRVLMREAAELLEGVYGLHTDGHFEPPENLPGLTDPEKRSIYDELVRHLEDEAQAGLPRPEAVEKLRKEIAFTHLNRLVAFKMMETRKLIRETVGRGARSNGFMFYLADHPEDEALWQAGQGDEAYRRFLLWQAGQVAVELKVLFDPQSLVSRLFPRAHALGRVLGLLNSPALEAAWRADETIGWVYQFFNEGEKGEVFDRLYKKKQKIRRQDIPAATQLFTPRWVVQYLVENTLGRLWVEMHPDTRLKEELRYLVPVGDEDASTAPRSAQHEQQVKPVREITLMDPACGTMHFGVLAFDLFAAMYREELERAGEPGWPENPSVSGPEEIPAAILAHNLYGIDIDLRAVQLSALALYLKAKALHKAARITRHNLACADVLAVNGARLGAFLREARFSRPIYERLVRALWDKLEDIQQLGSLLRLEQEVEALVAAERERYEREGRQMNLFIDRSEEFEEEAAREEYWAILGGQILQALDHFARVQAEAGRDQRFFAGEAAKGLRVLDLMLRDYDVVVTNPPYMGKRNMNATLADFLQDQYPEGKGDLYAAFIQRCAEFVGERGRVGMITQQSFMFISSYEKLRTGLLDEFVVETMAHTGPRTFAEIGGEKVNTTAFTLHREAEAARRQAHVGTYFRLVHAKDAAAKQAAFEAMLAALREKGAAPGVYRLAQGRFDAIPRSPWVYWVSERIRNIFEELPGLKDVAKPKQGLATGKNERFVRYIWEVRNSNIGFNYQSCQQTKDGRKKWFPYMKGGGYRKWYGNQTYLVNWKNDGKEIRNFTNKVGNVLSRPQNTSLYFEEGVTWSDLSSRGFGVRYLPPGFVFDVKGSSGFPQRQFILTVMAIMNSTWMGYALGLLNPTVSFQVGDISRVPVALPQKNEKAIIDTWTRTAVRIRMVEAKRDELTFEFISPWNFGQGLAQFQVSQERLAYVETRINEEVYRLYGISDEDRAAIEAELRGELLAADDKDAVLQDDETDETEVPLSHQELAVRWVSYAVGVVLGRFVPGGDGRPETGESASAISRRPSALGCAVYRREDFAIGSLPAPEEDEFNELVGPPESFAYLDESGGRHIFPREVEEALRALAVPDGITVLDEGHPRDLPALVERALVLMLGENQAAEVVALAAGLATEDQLTGYLSRHPQLDSAALRKFLSKDFFTQWHVKWYKKRPVYWPIQSQNRGYGFVIFHEKISRDTFFAIQRDPYLDSKRRAVGYQLEELEAQLRAAQGRARKALEKQLAQARKLAEELTAFAQTLERITLGADGLPGYTPAENWIDDGIILRMAPLWEVIPIWKSEPKKYWQRLQNGDYDWSHIAMHYWPERCLEKCKTNKSFAIAHGVEEIYEGG